MNLRFKQFLTTVLLALVGASTPVFAQDTGWYAGASVGQSKAKDACDGISGPGVSCDDKDTAWNIFGGYQFTKHFSAQLGYVDLGEVTASGLGVNANAKTKGFELLGGGTYPFNEQFSVYGKLGFFRWDVDASASGPGGSFSESETGTSFTHALGVKFNFTKTIAGTLQWQRYKDVGDTNTTDGDDVDVFSVGVIFKF